uniref:CPG4 domain-containing protein n=1 Tax=Panagrellus redivivus TaxID=6233 RepID=A0A7E4VVN5_PANRE
MKIRLPSKQNLLLVDPPKDVYIFTFDIFQSLMHLLRLDLIFVFNVLAGFAVVYAAPAPGPSALNTVFQNNTCALKCTVPATEHGHELNLLKNANLEHFFENHETVCGIINTAKKCVEDCGLKGENPFALKALTAHCSPILAKEVVILKKCLKENDKSINQHCTNLCGDHKAAYAQVRVLAESLVTEGHSPDTLHPLLAKTDKACGIFKCMTRCNVDTVTADCGVELGDSLRGLIQTVLDAQREDLDRLNITTSVAHTSPPQCNYLYRPEVMFNTSSDHSHGARAPVHHEVAECANQSELLKKVLERLAHVEALLEKRGKE